MRIIASATLAVALAAGSAHAGDARPDPTLTPGVVATSDPAVICALEPPRPSRSEWLALKRAAMRAYGIPWSQRGAYQLDHLVPRALGGADTLANLWPQPWPEARRKDAFDIEVRLGLCVTQMQTSTSRSWIDKTGRIVDQEAIRRAQRWFADGGWAR